MNVQVPDQGKESSPGSPEGAPESFAATILDSVADGYQLLDAQWRFVYLNASARQILAEFGVPGDELLGTEFFEVFSELRGSEVERQFTRAMNERTAVSFENFYPPWSRWFSVRAFPVPKGGLAVLFHDITAQKVAELRERERSEELQSVLKAVPAAIWIAHDPDCRMITGNPASYELLHVPVGRNASKSAPEGEGPSNFEIFADGRPLAPDELPVQRAARGEEVRNFEEEVRFQDGSSLFLFGNAVPLRDPSGKVRGAVAAFVDITERKRVDEALKARDETLRLSEARFRSLVDGAPVAITMSRAGQTLYANPAYRKCFGLRLDEDLTGRSILEQIAPEEHERIRDLVRRRYEGEDAPRSYEFAAIRTDGSRFVAHVDVDQIQLPDGSASIAFVYDVTDRQRALEALNRANREHQEARAELERIVDTMTEGLLVADHTGMLVFMNRAALQIHRFGSLAEIRKPLEDFGMFECRDSDGKLVPMEHWPVARALRGERFEQMELQVTRKDINFRFWGSYSGAPVLDETGKVRLAAVTLSDITPRKEAAQDKARLAAIVESSEDAIISKDLNGRVTSWNRGAERLLGFAPDEVIGQPIIRVIPPERHDEEARILEEVRAGRVVEPYETVRRRKSGELLEVSLAVSPVRDEHGRVVGASSIARDITRRKRAEEALHEAQAKLAEYTLELEKVVAERTARLHETVNELQTVSYSIAHDMRAPLRAMSMFAEILLEETAPGLPVQAQDYCRRIWTGANRLDKLIHDALNYNKAVLQELPLEPVNLSRLLRGLIDTYPNLHPDKAEIVMEPALPEVLGNESLLTQCFSNLLGNAVKFVPERRIPRVRVRSEASGERARVWIEDNGIGIPREVHPRLFGMFQKLDTAYEGTGMGLAIVRKVVERMGGKVGVESEVGQGSRFWVELQLASATKPGPNDR